MSNNHSDHSGSGSRYQSADEIVRSILHDHSSPSSEISPSGELYRAIERFQANAHRRTDLVNSARRELVRSHLNRWAAVSDPPSTAGAATRPTSRNSMSSNANYGSDSHPNYSRDPQQGTTSTASLPPLRYVTNSSGRRSAAPTAASPAQSGSRYGRWRAERYSERPRAGTPGHATRSSTQTPDNAWQMSIAEQRQQARRMRLGQNESDVQQLYDLDHANNQLSALLDLTPPPPPPVHAYSELSFPSPPLRPQESTDDNRRAKRRKLDLDRVDSGFRGFRYGKYGQVEPGTLTMEIESCDGGIYAEDGSMYGAENILKNDASVYCTKGPRCNIVLRHQGTTPFDLKELIIKAPRQNYTSPVREGMVFVSMNSDSLFARTARYRIQYTPDTGAQTHRSTRGDPAASFRSVRHGGNGAMMTSGLTTGQIRARRIHDIGMEDNENGTRSAQIPSEFTTSPPLFRVDTTCSDGEDDPTSIPYWRTPNRIGSLPFESDESSWDEPEPIVSEDYGPRRRRFVSPPPTAAAAPAEGDAPSKETVRAEAGLMAAHARFFIEPDKSKCTIKFDPPVSGRFILLKMWSPQPDVASNIDIQAVIANGYAGPRYFPQVELR